jgi:hypothetical protein
MVEAHHVFVVDIVQCSGVDPLRHGASPCYR